MASDRNRMPAGLAALLGALGIGGLGMPTRMEINGHAINLGSEEEGDEVLIGDLNAEEIAIYESSEKCHQELHAMERKAKRLIRQIENDRQEIMEKVEARHGIPHNVGVHINLRTKQVFMEREDAEHLKIKYTDQSAQRKKAEA